MRRAVIALALVAIAVGCGDERRTGPGTMPGPRGPEGGILEFDADMLPGPDAGRSIDAGRRDTGGPDTGSFDAGDDPSRDTRLFVPDISYAYAGTLTDPGFEVIAATIREDGITYPYQLVIAIRNTSRLVICAIDFEVRFYDAGGAMVGRTWGPIEELVYRGVSGTGDLMGCVGPGQTGMQAAGFDPGFRPVEGIVRAEWEIGGLNIVDAVATSDIVARDITTGTDSFGRTTFRGRIENRSRNSVRFPQIAIYGVNAVGRPLFAVTAIESTTISAGSSWSFETRGFRDTFASFVAFPEADDF